MEGAPVEAVVGLGANLGDPAAALETALRRIAALPGTALVAASSPYRTDPVGGPPQPPFLNRAALVRTSLDPHALLAALQGLEAEAGRERSVRWGPRTLDLDLLLYGRRVVDTPELVVPHPRLVERRFALEPLLEVLPEAVLPDGRRLADVVRGLPRQGVRRLPA